MALIWGEFKTRDLFRELRRREVFRTVGLYVGICWILIEVGSVLLPAFEAPEWILRGLILAAILGFPIAVVLAWIYDITERRLVHDTPQRDAVVQGLGARKMDFVVIGILTVALTISVYLNVTGGPSVADEIDPVSVLIADFDNRTGDQVFDGLLEQALNIGIESAPHVRSLDRRSARSLIEQVQPGTETLTAPVARLVAVREGVDVVLSASVQGDDTGYRLQLQGLDPISGETLFEAATQAASKDTILGAVGSLSERVREELGDETVQRDDSETAETFTAASIDAAIAYMRGVEIAVEGRDEEAVEYFREATEIDSNLGRAYSSWALSEFRLGREDEAARLWERALSLMDTMTERERLRTLGVYYFGASRNYEEAFENFAELVEKYPADAAGRNNLAVTAFYTLDFETAAAEGKQILEFFPNNELYRSNAALYSMYAGNFNDASRQAMTVIDSQPDYGTPYLPLAISLAVSGDFDGAREAYRHMAAASRSPHRESVATLGLADLSIYLGNLPEAREILEDGIVQDLADDVRFAAATKKVALAESFTQSGDYSMAVATANEALGLSTRSSIRVASAIVFLESGNSESASRIADELSAQLNTFDRAYGRMIDAVVLRQSGDYIAAIEAFRSAIGLADLWQIRYQFGRTYLEAGFFAEAFGEFDACRERRGEATAIFLDEIPTFRQLADLLYWLGRAQEGLGMETAAIENYRSFLTLRPEGGPLAEDVRRRTE